MTTEADPGPGKPGSGPPRGRDFGDFVRLALKSAADQVEPCTDGPEGLVPIRARILAAGVRHQQVLAGPEVNTGNPGPFGINGLVRKAGPSRTKAGNGTCLLWAV